ncbi:hypothetical protein ACJMK2_021888 [Sinanodonta woodiana]|uniref:MAM domain-containing protein n=1 Tax=Sinanodonta woodiana TaxID=1069815 RepID=A0ABD3TIL2_SINWO
MKKMMKLWMLLIFIEPFISAYTNPVNYDFHFDINSRNWSIEGFRRISYNQFSSTDGLNNNMHGNDCNFLDGVCSWKRNQSNVATQVNYDFKSTRKQSCLTFGFDIYSGVKCLSFKYQMKDFEKECISIEVYYNDGIYWCLVRRSQKQHQFQELNKIDVNINVEDKSTFAIRFIQGNCSNVSYNISSISLRNQSCTESTTTFRTPSAATTVNASSFYGKEGVIIGIVIGGVAFTVAVLLIATYFSRRRATSPNADISKQSTVSSVTCSGVARPNTDNAATSQSIDRLSQTSENVSPYNAQAEYSTGLKTQPRQSKSQHRFIKETLNIYPCQVQWLNDKNKVTNPEQIQNHYHPSADKDCTNSYDTVHNMDNHTTEFRDNTYDCTTIHLTTIPDPTYDHLNFKQAFDNVYDHATSGTLNKDIRYSDHSCDNTLQLSMQHVDRTYDHI